jgi:bacillithiol synthase
LTSEWSEQLRAKGLSPQVESVRRLSLVFVYEDGIKRRVPVAEASRISGGKTELGATVLLRPVVETFILPTVAYAGGPGEVAYFAQIPPIAESLDVARPTIVPRWSTTIVEPGIDRLLARYGVKIEELRELEILLSRLVRQKMPAEIASPLSALRQQIEADVTALGSGAARHGLDRKIVDGLKAQLALRLDRGERRVVAALKHREAEMRRDLGTARASLYPGGVRQERALSFLPFVARYEDALIERMLVEAARHADHLIGASSETGRPIATSR